MKCVVCILGILAGVASLTASAEIYRCVDTNGRSSFSNTPCPDEAVEGNSTAHQLWRKMRKLVNEGNNINQLLGADVQSIIQCKRNAKKFSADLIAVDERLNTLSPIKHKSLFKAMDFIRACGECRVAASTDCKNASTQLDEEMNVLLDLER
ncbi:MAG: DUF4124 domain-containing protein [Spongiibacteraceae bacterium]|nr:DUF4124 domain-containing protein [Spongiibacteraceae bacterium]